LARLRYTLSKLIRIKLVNNDFYEKTPHSFPIDPLR